MPTPHSAASRTPDGEPRQASPLAETVQRSLSATPKYLDPLCFYDSLGSALFDAICRLPWYTITRAEHRLLKENASSIVERFGSESALIELGPGNGEKLAYLTEALSQSRGMHEVHLVDISGAALETAAGRIEGTGYRASCHKGDFLDGLDAALRASRSPRRIACFLGSNLGNFAPIDAAAFLGELRERMRENDGLFLGFDLVKDAGKLCRAYDDPLGVTAAFNKNALVHINRELDGTFDIAAFDHKAVWNEKKSRVEMHLVANRPQTVRLGALDLDVRFEKHESIWTESSHKYTLEGIKKLLREAGFKEESVWVDEADGFAEGFYLAV